MAKRADRGPNRPLDRDEVDWDDLIRQYSPRLRRRVARHVPEPAIVADVVQETFIHAYASWSTYDQSRQMWPWLATIAVNRAWQWSQASQLVAAVDRRESFAEAPLVDYFAVGSDDHVANIDRRDAMRKALSGMTEKHRRILLAWELGDRSVAELAASLGLTPEALRATVVRARQSLRRRYLAAAGEGPFGWVVVGLGGIVARWRERFTRIASSGGWAEGASSLAAAPAMAFAGMAMITLAPAPSSQAPSASSITAQPIAVVHDAAPTSVASGRRAAAAVASTPGTTAAAPPPATSAAAADATTSTLSAGPAAAAMTSSSSSQQMEIDVDGPNGGADSRRWNSVNCEYNVATGAVCQLGEALPNQE